MKQEIIAGILISVGTIILGVLIALILLGI
jgi:hypothetical protein